MYYNDNRDRRNGNYGYGESRRSGRDNYGYNPRGGYDDRDREMMERPYEINQPVKHAATGIRLTVIRYGREQVECRKPDLSSEWFYLYELEPITDEQR